VRTIKARVARVIDGDTLMLEVRCRLMGISAPELTEPGGPEAFSAAKRRYHNQEIQFRIITADDYGRAVIQIYPSSGGKP
jgi:endonuclease YncB( thermonuclease family)